MSWFGWRNVETRGVLIAGRTYDFSDFTRGQVVALCEAIAAIGERAGAPIVAVPADVDLSDDTCTDDDPAYCTAYVGVLAAEGGTRAPLAVPREAMLGALKRAQAIPAAIWDRITAAYHEAGGEQDIEEEVVLRLACTGGLPAARLVFGVLGKAGEARRDPFVRGKDPDQNPHPIGVYGLLIQGCAVDSPSLPIDVGEKAHAPRAGKVKSGAYYLVAEYD